jgi:hypothetical protein
MKKHRVDIIDQQDKCGECGDRTGERFLVTEFKSATADDLNLSAVRRVGKFQHPVCSVCADQAWKKFQSVCALCKVVRRDKDLLVGRSCFVRDLVSLNEWPMEELTQTNPQNKFWVCGQCVTKKWDDIQPVQSFCSSSFEEKATSTKADYFCWVEESKSFKPFCFTHALKPQPKPCGCRYEKDHVKKVTDSDLQNLEASEFDNFTEAEFLRHTEQYRAELAKVVQNDKNQDEIGEWEMKNHDVLCCRERHANFNVALMGVGQDDDDDDGDDDDDDDDEMG